MKKQLNIKPGLMPLVLLVFCFGSFLPTLVWAIESVYIVRPDDAWFYNDEGVEIPHWMDVDFHGNGWKFGSAPLGVQTGDFSASITTKLEARQTTYFRYEFTVEEPNRFNKLRFSAQLNDGALVYLNGVEVLRYNMPAGPITAATPAQTAVGPNDQIIDHNFSVSRNLGNPLIPWLQRGKNVIAVELHQYEASPSSVFFNLNVLPIPQFVGVETRDGKFIFRWNTTNPSWVLFAGSFLNTTNLRPFEPLSAIHKFGNYSYLEVPKKDKEFFVLKLVDPR